MSYREPHSPCFSKSTYGKERGASQTCTGEIDKCKSYANNGKIFQGQMRAPGLTVTQAKFPPQRIHSSQGFIQACFSGPNRLPYQWDLGLKNWNLQSHNLPQTAITQMEFHSDPSRQQTTFVPRNVTSMNYAGKSNHCDQSYQRSYSRRDEGRARFQMQKLTIQEADYQRQNWLPHQPDLGLKNWNLQSHNLPQTAITHRVFHSNPSRQQTTLVPRNVSSMNCAGKSNHSDQSYQRSYSRRDEGRARFQKQKLSIQEADCENYAEWKANLREWKVVNRDTNQGSHGMKLSVMTYNILSQSLLTGHPYLYEGLTKSDLDWSSRGPALYRQFKHHRPDVICLQEVEQQHWDESIQRDLKALGYKGFLTKKTGDKPDGCAILFKSKKFTLLDYMPVKFQRGGVLDRDNVGTILTLRPRSRYYKGTNQKICVATTHLLFNPKREDVRLAQLMLFLAEVERCAFVDDPQREELHSGSGRNGVMHNRADKNVGDGLKMHPYCPVIFCGDLNSEPDSRLYKFITQGFLQYNASHNVSTHLLPESLGINENCQFIQQVLKRFAQQGHCSSGLATGFNGNSQQTSSHLCQTACNQQATSNQQTSFKQQSACSQQTVSCQQIASTQKTTFYPKTAYNLQTASTQQTAFSQPPPLVVQSWAFNQVTFHSWPGLGQFGQNTHQPTQLLPWAVNSHIKVSSSPSPIKLPEQSKSSTQRIHPSIRMNTGQARHSFNFKSAYPHHEGRFQLVTTHHHRASCTVDYIFYSSGETVTSSSPLPKRKKERKEKRGKRKRCESNTSLSEFSARRHKSSRDDALLGKVETETFTEDNSCRRQKYDSPAGRENSSLLDSSSSRSKSKKTPDSLSCGECSSGDSDSERQETNSASISSLSDFDPGGLPRRHCDSPLPTCYHDRETAVTPAGNEKFSKNNPCLRDSLYESDIPNSSYTTSQKTSSSTVKSLELMAYWSLLSTKQMKEYKCLPNHIFPSDHICLIAKFVLH